jgi:hypothetical protein
MWRIRTPDHQFHNQSYSRLRPRAIEAKASAYRDALYERDIRADSIALVQATPAAQSWALAANGSSAAKYAP